MSVCALRYDGSGSPIDARKVLDRIAETGELDADPEANFAAFHLVQRATRHWGCGLLWDHDPWQVAAGFLFLELRNQEPPARYAFAEECAAWSALSTEDRERAANLVRRWLVSERPGVSFPLWDAPNKKYGVPIKWSEPEPDDEPRKSRGGVPPSSCGAAPGEVPVIEPEDRDLTLSEWLLATLTPVTSSDDPVEWALLQAIQQREAVEFNCLIRFFRGAEVYRESGCQSQAVLAGWLTELRRAATRP